MHELVGLHLMFEFEINVLLAQVWVVAAVSHASVLVALLSGVISEVLYRLVLD